MSMKRDWFPMQDEHENGGDGVGILRPGESAHAECREFEPIADSRVSRIERRNRFWGRWTFGDVRLDRASPGGAGIRMPGQKGTRVDSSLRGESNGAEPVASDPVD